MEKMVHYIVAALFAGLLILLILLQTEFFGKYVRHAALATIAMGAGTVIFMFIYIDEEDWRYYFGDLAREETQSERMKLRLSEKDGGKAQLPRGIDGAGKKSTSDTGGVKMGAFLTISDDQAGTGQPGKGAFEEMQPVLGKGNYGFRYIQNPGDISSQPYADHPANFIHGTGLNSSYPPNAHPDHLGSTPGSAAELARRAGLETEPSPEDKTLQKLWDCETCPRVVIIPVGKFKMGSPEHEQGHELSEAPQIPVEITKPFAIGMFEITRYQFRIFMDSTNYTKQDHCSGHSGILFGLFGERKLEPHEYDHPELCLTWHDANAYVDWLTETTGVTYRLPTAAEWEYAARAQTQTAYSTGDTISEKQAHYLHPSRPVKQPSLIHKFQPNQFRLYNVHGNAAEWVADCWHSSLSDAPTTQEAWIMQGDCAHRVTKGGSWMDGTYDIRSAARGRQRAIKGSMRVGMRVVRELY